MTGFVLVTRMRVRAGRLEQFKRQAAECIRQAVAKDVGPLHYDWFLSRDGTRCEIREAYSDSEALPQHQANVRDAVDRLFGESAADPVTTVYGEPSLQFVRLADALGAEVTWFSPFAGPVAPAPRH